MTQLEKKKVIVIGTGGVGSIVAYGVDFVGKSDVSIVVRRDYESVSKDGYTIHSCDYGEVNSWKPNKIFPSVQSAANSGIEFDYIVVTTKNIPEFAKVEDLINPLIKNADSVVVLIQNGFDLARPLFEKYPNNVVISGVSHIGSRNSNGTIYQTQKDKCLISSFENPNLPKDMQLEKVHEFISLYRNENNDIQFFPNAKWYRYRKLVYNATLNTVCALTGTDTGRLEFSGGLDKVSIPAMKEVIAVAKADGVDLPSDIINLVCHSDDGDYFEPSMRIDVKKGNLIELRVILGNLLIVAKELKVDTPILDIIFNLLEVVQFRLMEDAGLVSVPKERPVTNRFYK